MRTLLTSLSLPVFVLAPFALACGDSGSGGAGGSAGTTNPTTTSANASSATGTTTTSSNATSGSNASSNASTTASGSSGSGTGCDVPEPMYDGLGCLTYESANDLCGFESDEAICAFSVGCGVSKDVGQCKINCEQGSSSFCNDMVKTTCVIDSFCTQDCAKLETCGFIL